MKIELEVGDPKRLWADLCAAIDACGNGKVAHRLREVRSQIEAQVPKPRIPEPSKWGVVEAGVKQHDIRLKWVRVDGGWLPEDSDEYARPWSLLIDPVLIREGI